MIAADLVSSLNAKSLVQRAADVEGEARFQLLETVREWGLDHLDSLGELQSVRDLHARWYLSQAESLGPVEHFAAISYVAPTELVVDAVAAAAHLREHDVTGAALIIGRFEHGIAQSGLGPLAREIQLEARSAGWQRSSARLWLAEYMLCTDLLEQMPFADPPPADDGSFEWRFMVGGAEHAGDRCHSKTTSWRRSGWRSLAKYFAGYADAKPCRAWPIAGW